MDSPLSTSGPTTCRRPPPGTPSSSASSRTSHSPGPDGVPAYIEFRIGDSADELGIIDRRYAPPGAAAEPGGAIMHWHVDDLEGTVERLLALGADRVRADHPAQRGLRHGLGGRSVRQRARGDVQPALRRDGRGNPEGVSGAPARVPRRRGLGGLAGRSPRGRHRGLAADRQARLWSRDAGHRRRAGRRAVLGLDRRSAQRSGRPLVPAALLPATTAQLVVADQRGQGRGPDRRRPDATAGARRGRGGAGGRPVGRRVRVPAHGRGAT